MITYFLLIVLVFSGIIFVPNVFAENVPAWIKNNAGWWAEGQIDDNSFVSGIEWLVSNGIIEVPSTTVSGTAETTIPGWVKNTAGWWAGDQISGDDFVNAIQYLIKVSIITIPQAENVLADSSTLKPSVSILDTTSFFEVEVDFLCYVISKCPELYDKNSEGFRGAEFSKDKPDDTFRIITVGGSTTFGAGVTEENAWPRILEKKLQNISEGKNIEVINAGIPAIASFAESKLVKEKLIHLEPDLIIVYDGANDVACRMNEHVTKYHVETKEVKIMKCGIYSPDNYDKTYAERWSEICNLGEKNGFETVIIVQPLVHFDKILTDQELSSYFDRQEHTLYLDSLESFAQQLDNVEKHCTKTADFRGIFDNYFEPLYWDYVHVGDQGNEILAGKVLELISPLLHEKGITKQIPVQPNIIKPSQDPAVILQLYEANWGNLLPNQKSFIGQNLSGKDFSNSNLVNENFFGSDLRNANFENSNVSGSDFSLANLKNANFKNAVIDGIKLRQTILDRTDFSNVDFSQVNLEYIDLTNAILKNSHLDNQDLTKTFLYKADLSGADLSKSDLSVVYLKDTVLKDANLTTALLYEADLSLAHNKDLSGTVLTGAALTWSDLKGIDFSGKDLSVTNFQNSDLTDQDFTNNVTIHSTDFQGANLSNADFEGVNLAPKEIFTKVFENKAYLLNANAQSIRQELFDNSNTFLFISAEARGNDLVVDFALYNNFSGANLENANFKNAKLWVVDFYSANLTNADLSGADLSSVNFTDADLSNANLEGAILSGAILSCKNHPICN